MFEISWKANPNKKDRWKMINKISYLNLLTEEKIFNFVLYRNNSIEWEAYLGNILEQNKRAEFKDFWIDYKAENQFKKYSNIDPRSWVHTIKLINIVLKDKEYIIGDID